MKSLLYIISSIITLSILIICILTPEKTLQGEYTDAVQYWSNNTYYTMNFIDPLFIPLQHD